LVVPRPRRRGNAVLAADPPEDRHLHVTLTGQFPHASPTAPEDLSGQELTVDARTGRVCDDHYLTGPVAMDPEAVLLFTNY